MIEISGGRVRRRDKRIWFVALGVFAAVALFTFLSRYHGAVEEDVEAASLANFDPGFIISDYQMGNYTSMTEAEIQAFLSAKGNCRDTNIGKANSYPHLSYHIKDGHFVCLAEEVFGDGIDYGDAAPNGESAAHIIWQAAQDYKINPQVILVLLQKEQSLITDSWPNNVQYRSATGYGCPDTAACSTKYYGFKNQVRNAAGLFRTVLDGGWTNYPLGNNYVQYNPNAACGGSVVNIRSLATSALYRYTPYQPNAGALAAGYGTATCGAYGNRNFYLYFQDWFGGITNQGYLSLDEPRYLKLINDANRINPFTKTVVDSFDSGMIRWYSSKILLADGQWCFRTEYSTQYNDNACIAQSDLGEIELEYEDLPEEEQEKMIKETANKVDFLRRSTLVTFIEPSIRKFVKKTNFLGETYYITEYDSKNNNLSIGIKEEYLSDGFDYFESEMFVVVKDTERTILGKGKYDLLEKGKTIEFSSSIIIDEKKYYRTKHNTENNINAVVPSTDLVLINDYDYEKFENPRKMRLNSTVDRVNPYTNEKYDSLEKGRIIDFSTKILLNGQWYYRTKHNTENNINAAISSKYLDEV